MIIVNLIGMHACLNAVVLYEAWGLGEHASVIICISI